MCLCVYVLCGPRGIGSHQTAKIKFYFIQRGCKFLKKNSKVENTFFLFQKVTNNSINDPAGIFQPNQIYF